MKHLFIIDPISFWNKSKQNNVVAGIHQFFRGIQGSDYEIHVSRFPRDAAGFIPLYAGNLPDETSLRVYAVGDDETLFDCLNGMVGLKNVELASVPYGYSDNFIRGFSNNNKSLFRILSRQYNAPVVPVDVMRCGNNYALNYCVIGVEAEAIRLTKKIQEESAKGGPLHQWIGRRMYTLFYLASTFTAGRNKELRGQRYEGDIAGESFNGVYRGFSVFNGPYFGESLRPVSNAVPTDGILEMLGIRSHNALLHPFYVSGRHQVFPKNFILKRGKNINIRSEDTLVINMDGIMFYEKELEIELLPAAVKFVDAGRQLAQERRQ
jgi:diacylglycerol kinase family enzyme